MSSPIDFGDDVGLDGGAILSLRFVKGVEGTANTNITANSPTCMWGSNEQIWCVGCGERLRSVVVSGPAGVTMEESCSSHGRINDLMMFSRFPGTPANEILIAEVDGDEELYYSPSGELKYRFK